MPQFSIVVEYLTGYAVATDPSSRERAEWPPHPARVFMAMAAAFFESDGSSQEKGVQREALDWLASLPAPALMVPEHRPREVLEVFVPVNDQKGENALLHRSRQPRTFPRVFVGDEPAQFIWPFEEDAETDRHLSALDALCRSVTRVGHSSSLVWMRIERDAEATPTHLPDASGLGTRLRTPFKGMLGQLEALFGESDRQEHAVRTAELDRLRQDIKQTKGKDARDRKAQLQMRQSELLQLTRSQPRAPIRPAISWTTSYRPVEVASTPKVESLFDPHFIVLREHEDAAQSFGLESTPQLVEALRDTVMSHCGIQPVPRWVSGHESNGDPLRTGPHIAMAPLAFVGSPYADGHLLGLAIFIPRAIPLADRGRALSSLLFDADDGSPRRITLQMGSLGVWDLVRAASGIEKRALQTATYTQPSCSWASVTPIVLDRMPKSDRVKEAVAWREEVANIVAASCINVGLPKPVSVRVEKTPLFLGSLRAMPGQGGFPSLRKGRIQVHAQVTFDGEVEGPVLLGAGRFRGYGLMRPWKEGGR